MKNLDLYKEIEENLENSRQAILAYNEDPENDEELRSLDQANLILQALKQIAESAFSLFRDYPSLEAVFEKEYGFCGAIDELQAVALASTASGTCLNHFCKTHGNLFDNVSSDILLVGSDETGGAMDVDMGRVTEYLNQF